MRLGDFLLARITEDEDEARQFSAAGYDEETENVWGSDRVLAECAAKRRIVAAHPHGVVLKWTSTGMIEIPFCETCEQPDVSGDIWPDGLPCDTLRALALPYADHADYDPTWEG